jgi:hypothetical protein
LNKRPLTKIPVATAAEICAKFNLPGDARGLLEDGMPPGAFIEALLAKQKFVAAVDFMAHALPLREGIWWGCLCMQHGYGDNLTAAERAAAIAAVQWVFEPGEETRAAAKSPAEAAGPATPAGALAMAVSLAGPPSLKAVANAVKLASIKVEPIQIANVQRAFVELGLEVAEGQHL